jgi:hypothetical protein
MGKLMLIAIISFFCFSCHKRRNAINPFVAKTHCFKDTLSGLEKRIKLHGYYEFVHEYTVEGVQYRNKKLTNIQEKHFTKVKNLFYDNGLVY